MLIQKTYHKTTTIDSFNTCNFYGKSLEKTNKKGQMSS